MHAPALLGVMSGKKRSSQEVARAVTRQQHSDAEILSAFNNIAAELGQDPEQSHLTVMVMDGLSPYQDIPLLDIQNEPFAQHAEQYGTASWEDARVYFRPLHVQVQLRRDREQGDDRITVLFSTGPSDPMDPSRTLAAVCGQFVPLNQLAAIQRALGPEMVEFYRLREDGLSRLEALTQKLVSETHAYRLKLDGETAGHKRALTESFEEKTRELDAEYKERSDRLESREQDLNDLRRELDDRTARHARREQSRALQEKISDRSQNLTLTLSTQRKRYPVHIIFSTLLFLSAALIPLSLLTPVTATEGAEFWLGLGRLPLGELGFALTAVSYIRWTDQWFRQHANQEFRLQKLALDVDRAGYATEMLLEWQEDKGGEIPAVIVDRLTTGLFTDHEPATRVRHPSEDVTATVLKAASSIRVDIPGIGEVALTGRQLRGLDKKLSEEQEK